MYSLKWRKSNILGAMGGTLSKFGRLWKFMQVSGLLLLMAGKVDGP